MNLNPIDFTYIDGENTYPLQDYVDDKIYQLSSTGITTSNVIINNQKLNDVIYFSNSNLYFKNKINDGEIYFSTAFNYPVNTNFDYGTKISNSGKLLVYHNFNLLQPTFAAGWYDVESEILQLKADGINTDLQLTLLDASIVFLQEQITGSDLKIQNLENFKESVVRAYTRADTFESFQNVLFAPNSPAAINAINQSFNIIRQQSQQAYLNALGLGAIYGVAFGLGGAVLGYIGSRLDQDRTSNALYNNQNINNTDKNIVFNYSSNIQSNLDNISNFNLSMSNLNTFQGFVNSNINVNNLNITNLKATSSFQYQGQELSTTLGNYLLKAGGTMTGRINFNYGAGIFGTPVAGGGGNGERINLNMNGITGSDFPPSFGVSTDSLWNSVPNNHKYQWYINGIERMSLSSAGVLNATSILENNISIPNISQSTILNNTPNVQKKYMFTGTCSSSILMPDGFTYFAYDVDVRNYTQLKYAPNPNTPYRIFNIKIFFGSVYFGYLTNGRPNVLSYEVYMSNESQAGGGGIGSAGLNVCAVGYPENPTLNTISPTQLSLVCGDFNFVSVLSRVNGTVFNAIIEDVLF